MDRQQADIILVVDDEPLVRDSISLILGTFGYHVIDSSSAAEAMMKFHETDIDVVLTDIKMPDVTGIELLEKIHAINPEMPVILMTAYADIDIAVDAIKKGAFDFIIKPYQTEQLIHSIKKAVKYQRLINVEENYKHMLEEFNNELETLVAERTMNLMALTVADKVRNPAAAIGWTCRRILEKEDISDAVRNSLNEVICEAEKLEAIVRDFHSLLKDRQSMFRYEDINDILENVVSVIKKDADNKKIELAVSLSKQPLKINAQKNLLGVAIFHVLRNAVEATPEGGRVSIEAYGDSKNIVLAISDTGYGISEEDIEKIFNPFFSTKKQRFGMGLSLVKQIISEHLGEIKVESSAGKGTVFRITFPVRWVEKAL